MLDPWIIWLIAGLLLLVAEILVPGVILVFFGLGALLTAALALLGLDDLGAQLGVFAVSSLLMLLLLRRVFRRTFTGNSENNKLVDEFIGQEAIVVVTIAPGSEGRVEIKGANWRARSDQTLEAGLRTRIVARDGLVLVVENAPD